MFSNKAIFCIAWPLGMNAMLLQGILIIDTLMVSPLGEQALAAMGLSAGLAGLMIGIIFAFSNGSQMLLAQAHGAQSKLALKSGYWSGLVINISVGCCALLLMQIIIPYLLPLLAATAEIETLATEYLSWFSLVFISLAIAQNFTAFYNASGNTAIPFYSNLLELPLNAALSYIFIYGAWGFPEMGLKGAALGTVVAVTMRTVFLYWCFNRQLLKALKIPYWTQQKFKATLINHFIKSLPIANTFITMTLSLNVCLLIYAQLPVYAFAALTLLFPWIRISGHIVTAWAQASGILVGQMIGSQQLQLLDSFVSRAWRVALYLSLLVTLLYACFSTVFTYLYPDLKVETTTVLWQLTPILLCLPLIRSSNTLCGHMLRAGGDASFVFKVHFFSQWLITVPLSALLVLYWEVSVFWVFGVILLEELIKGIPFHLRIHRDKWKRDLID
ncbi:MAG: polysaccharide biosynthesis C-terminal domain-containing protein [Oceanospirillaceae bacterium]|nr:polysaccharide biosynthesis C-terminal domain-containing protein [Oceanospirillaceae bacterium]